ncbi:MAG TPA: hypothetical protein VFI11_13395 [Anaerolineales bacterium]|nr:hypothetical protein [Anaerolineales bacterium]
MRETTNGMADGGSRLAGTHSHGDRVTHGWLKRMKVAFVPGPTTATLDAAVGRLRISLEHLGHQVQATPTKETDLILTTAAWGEPVPWRTSLLFSARRRFGLDRATTVVTLIHVTPAAMQARLEELAAGLQRSDALEYPGLTPRAHRVLREQGARGGPMLALVRLVQSQALSIRIILCLGDDQVQAAHYFDLVGAHPRVECVDSDAFFEDMSTRLATAVSTSEVVDHETIDPPVPASVWRSLETKAAMQRAAEELDRRGFFTEMVRIADLVDVPMLAEAVAEQYSEGCFATWDPDLGALISTVTGSARPVDKGHITDEDLAVVVGVRPDGRGARVRAIEGHPSIPPSSEAVEMILMDADLPRVSLDGSSNGAARVPALRSKLHGHRGIAAFDPAQVEFVPLDPAYYDYPVSCGTEAQAWAIREAFDRSVALRTAGDPRRIVFTVLPGHGAMLGEKWVEGKRPFQVLWEAMDSGALVVSSKVPQARYAYRPGDKGVHQLVELDPATPSVRVDRSA